MKRKRALPIIQQARLRGEPLQVDESPPVRRKPLNPDLFSTEGLELARESGDHNPYNSSGRRLR